MQISGSSYSSYTQSAKTAVATPTIPSKAKPDYQMLADYDSRDNVIFQNLLKDESVQDNVKLNDDGTYTFVVNSKEGLSTEEMTMKNLIAEQNGDFWKAGDVTPLTKNELAMFRQVTGYNYIQAGGLTFLVDDYGHAIPPEDRAVAEATRDTFDMARGIQDMTDPSVELSVKNVKDVAQMFSSRVGADQELWKHILDMLANYAENIGTGTEATDALFGDDDADNTAQTPAEPSPSQAALDALTA
jgi:hypothetical protein